MNFSPVFLMKFKNTVERILHVRGNYNGGILEMAVVLDHNVEREIVQELVPELFRTLKMHSEVFRNVRLNVVQWESDEVITNQVTPMSMAGLSSFYKEYQCQQTQKDWMKLIAYLKMFQARSKLIILITTSSDSYDEVDKEQNSGSLPERLKIAMQPFLDKKLMQVIVDKEFDIRYR